MCQVRMPGICRARADDCVLAHAHFAGLRGTSGKAFDVLGAWACSACHDEYDRRTDLIDADVARLWFYEGVLRTIDILLTESILITAGTEATRPARARKRKPKGNTAAPAKGVIHPWKREFA